MVRKLYIQSIIITLFSFTIIADHHNLCSKIREKKAEMLADVKSHEKTDPQKIWAASLQTANRLSWVIALGAGIAAGYFVPPSHYTNEPELAIAIIKNWALRLIAVIATSSAAYATIKTAAATAQENKIKV